MARHLGRFQRTAALHINAPFWALLYQGVCRVLTVELIGWSWPTPSYYLSSERTPSETLTKQEHMC
jgi:hypothetical protein